jgi:hypothetical protein
MLVWQKKLVLSRVDSGVSLTPESSSFPCDLFLSYMLSS